MFCPRLKILETPKMISFWLKKINLLHNYSPAAIGTAFSTKFVLDTKLRNSAFWNISKLGICCNSVILNINFKKEWVLRNTKIYRKCNQTLCLGLIRKENSSGEVRNVNSRGRVRNVDAKGLGQDRNEKEKDCRQIHKIKSNRFFYGMFYSWFFATLTQMWKFIFTVVGCLLAMKHFRDFF